MVAIEFVAGTGAVPVRIEGRAIGYIEIEVAVTVVVIEGGAATVRLEDEMFFGTAEDIAVGDAGRGGLVAEYRILHGRAFGFGDHRRATGGK